MISRSGRVEKAVDAHKGAVLMARWSFDGASLLTGLPLSSVITEHWDFIITIFN